MQIIWHGQSCFEIIITKAKGEHTTILIDPLNETKTGIRTPKTGAQIVLFTNKTYTADAAATNKIAAGAFVVDGPGEYEIKDIYIRGIDFNFGRTAVVQGFGGPKADTEKSAASKHTGTIYTIEGEEMKLCHLGDLRAAELTQGQVEKIGNIDILMFPLGDAKAFGAKEALHVLSQIEPCVAVPMNYQIPNLKLPAGNLKEFLKAAGVGKIDSLPKLTIKKKEINPEEAKIIVLTP